jgi:hypothetical protein
MQNCSRCFAIVAAAVAGFFVLTAPVAAQTLKLTMGDGRVTLVAHEVPLRQVLDEWARIGDTRIVNGDKLFGPPITLELVDVPEGRALDLVLRQAAGYMAAPRPQGAAGVSVYDRIMILPTSKAPAASASAAIAPPPFNRNVMPQPQPVAVNDQDEAIDQGPVPQPGMVPQGSPVPGVQPFPTGAGPQQQPVLTSPRPGQLPQPQQPAQGPAGSPMNPYAPPGTVQPYAPPPTGPYRQPPALPNRPGAGGQDQ